MFAEERARLEKLYGEVYEQFCRFQERAEQQPKGCREDWIVMYISGALASLDAAALALQEAANYDGL